MGRGKLDLREPLEYIDPASLDYREWLGVGMALKQEGYPVSVWDDWSRRDPGRYHPGECESKWDGFCGSGNPVTGGSIVQMARSRGWQTARSKDGGAEQHGRELGWDDMIGLDEKEDLVLVDRAWLEEREIAQPEQWDPARELITYLELLFSPGECVGYVTRSFEKDGRRLPTKGCYDRTAEQLIEQLKKCGGDLGAVLGDYDPAAGAWIRFNPLDGKGVKNDNVTAFRYALVESDTLPVERQHAIIQELELPVAALVHSGGKSLHAIVRVDASGPEEYRRRVEYLYSVCRKNGLEPDRQNCNPSRLSRMPGVTRNGQKQFLAGTNLGKSSWSEWREWIEAAADDLPDPEGDLDTELPPLAPPLIENVLRQGHKMLLAGPSKAGKSFALIELAICIAEGLPWLGFSCARGRCMYVNLELDRASCLHRFRDVREAMGAPSEHSVDIWNLRGRSIPMDKLAPKLIRRAMRRSYTAIIIDPIYKVITGDENSADQMARFCNQFDKVCTELGCAVIYCHHHSKGAQGGKRSMDRASGSGVFARDPDALLDLIELPVSEEVRALQSTPEGGTAWRIEGTLREFAQFPPVNLWFDFPVHRLDKSGVLGDIDPENASPAWPRKRTGAPRDRRKERLDALDDAFAACDLEGTGEVPQQRLMEYTGKAKTTIQNWVDEHPGFIREGGMIRGAQKGKN